MPLANNITEIDASRIMTARSKNTRRYRVGNDQDFIDYIETVDTRTYEYPRLTKEVANTAIESVKNAVTAENQTLSASMVEDVRNVGSYKVISTSTFTTTTQAAVAPAPEVGGITWSRNSETVSSWPQSITMTSANSADRIWYRIDAINSSGATVPGTFINGGSNNVTVSLNASTLAAGYNGWHKRVIIIAEVRRTQLTGEVYVGAQSSRRFTQTIPQLNTPTTSINNLFPESSGTSSNFIFGTDSFTYSSSGSNLGGQTLNTVANVYDHRNVTRTTLSPGWFTWYFQTQSTSSGAGSHTISGINHPYTLIIGSSRRMCRSAKFEIYSYVTLDGYTYRSSTLERTVTQFLGYG